MNTDQGYSWLVLFTACIGCFINSGVIQATPLFLVNFTEAFDLSTSGAGWLISVYSFGSLCYYMIAGLLLKRLSCKAVGASGCLISFCTIVLASQSKNLVVFVISYCIFSPVCSSFVLLSSLVIVQNYFTRFQSFAISIVLCFESAGGFAISPLLGYLIQHFGWRGAMMLLGGILLNSMVCTLTFRANAEHRNTRKSKLSVNHTLKTILSNIGFHILNVAFLLYMFGSVVYLQMSAPRAELDFGTDKISASAILSALGIGGLFGRLFVTIIVNVKYLNKVATYSSAMIICGGLSILTTFQNNYTTVLIVGAFYGFFYGVVQNLQVIVLLDITGQDYFSASQGLMMFSASFTLLIVAPLSGLFYETYGSYQLAFFIGGVLQCTAGGVLVLLLILQLRQKFVERNNTEKTSLLHTNNNNAHYASFSSENSAQKKKINHFLQK